jgi:putative membrane protein
MTLSSSPDKNSESDPRPDLAYSRTHLANQRTYAAWLRTGLSMAAAGLVLGRLTPREALERPTALVLGALLVGLGASMILFGAWNFRHVAGRLAQAGTPPARMTEWVVYASAVGLVLLLLAALLLM